MLYFKHLNVFFSFVIFSFSNTNTNSQSIINEFVNNKTNYLYGERHQNVIDIENGRFPTKPDKMIFSTPLMNNYTDIGKFVPRQNNNATKTNIKHLNNSILNPIFMTITEQPNKSRKRRHDTWPSKKQEDNRRPGRGQQRGRKKHYRGISLPNGGRPSGFGSGSMGDGSWSPGDGNWWHGRNPVGGRHRGGEQYPGRKRRRDPMVYPMFSPRIRKRASKRPSVYGTTDVPLLLTTHSVNPSNIMYNEPEAKARRRPKESKVKLPWKPPRYPGNQQHHDANGRVGQPHNGNRLGGRGPRVERRQNHHNLSQLDAEHHGVVKNYGDHAGAYYWDWHGYDYDDDKDDRSSEFDGDVEGYGYGYDYGRDKGYGYVEAVYKNPKNFESDPGGLINVSNPWAQYPHDYGDMDNRRPSDDGNGRPPYPPNGRWPFPPNGRFPPGAPPFPPLLPPMPPPPPRFIFVPVPRRPLPPQIPFWPYDVQTDKNLVLGYNATLQFVPPRWCVKKDKGKEGAA